MSSLSYTQKCNDKIKKFIQDSTRLEPTDISLTTKEEFEFLFEIKLIGKLSIFTEQVEHKGRFDGDIVCADKNSYTEAISLHSEIEFSRKESLNEIHQYMTTTEYGLFDEQVLIHEYEKTISHTHKCDRCNGYGSLTCGECSGSGKKKCGGCGGSGNISKSRQVYDSYSKTTRYENYYESCDDCRGSGKKKCGNCSGSGSITCGRCNGSGLTTDVSKIKSVAIPEYQLTFYEADVPDFVRGCLYKYDIKKFREYGKVKFKDSNIDETEKSVIFNCLAKTMFARFDSTIHEKPVSWTMFGYAPVIFDAGFAIEILLKQDKDEIYKIADTRRFNPFIGSIAKKPLT